MTQRFGNGGAVGAERQQRTGRSERRKPDDPQQQAAERIPFHRGRWRTGRERRRSFIGCDSTSEQHETAEPKGRQRDGQNIGAEIGQAEDRPEAKRGSKTADGCAGRAPADRGEHQRKWCEIKQQQ